MFTEQQKKRVIEHFKLSPIHSKIHDINGRVYVRHVKSLSFGGQAYSFNMWSIHDKDYLFLPYDTDENEVIEYIKSMF